MIATLVFRINRSCRPPSPEVFRDVSFRLDSIPVDAIVPASSPSQLCALQLSYLVILAMGRTRTSGIRVIVYKVPIRIIFDILPVLHIHVQRSAVVTYLPTGRQPGSFQPEIVS